MRRVARITAGAAAAFVLLAYLGVLYPFWGMPFNASRHGRVPLTPPWALECWLWEDDVNTAAAVTELVEGYARHDLPVRTVMIDSPWSRRYNDFQVDPARYPDPAAFFTGLQDRGYRVVLWMTSMVDRSSKDTPAGKDPGFHEEARRAGYLAGGPEPFRWWKGVGGFIDYTNPEAMRWWRGLQEQVLQWGIDGWKLDGTDTFFSGNFGPLRLPYGRAHAGWLTTREYMDLYAREELRHGLSRNPEFTTLIRSIDRPWAHPEGFAPLDAAPVTWVGDNRHTWRAADRGLEAAIADILRAARLGYCVIGSDVAGYHGRSNPDDTGPATAALLAGWGRTPDAPPAAAPARPDAIAPVIYIRWAQFSAFCGLFLNGGHGERRLWLRSPAELEIVRKFSWLHTELVPYLYSHVVNCHRGGPPLMRPAAAGNFHYLLGDDLLVAPIHADSLRREVTLPPGDWRYLFRPAEPDTRGPARITRDFPLDEYPVYLRAGALVPLNVTRDYTGLGDRASAGFRTWLIHPGADGRFTLWHPESHPEPEATTVKLTAGDPVRVDLSGRGEPHLLRVLVPRAPREVTRNGIALAPGADWTYDAARGTLVVVGREAGPARYAIAWR